MYKLFLFFKKPVEIIDPFCFIQGEEKMQNRCSTKEGGETTKDSTAFSLKNKKKCIYYLLNLNSELQAVSSLTQERSEANGNRLTVEVSPKGETVSSSTNQQQLLLLQVGELRAERVQHERPRHQALWRTEAPPVRRIDPWWVVNQWLWLGAESRHLAGARILALTGRRVALAPPPCWLNASLPILCGYHVGAGRNCEFCSFRV